MHQHTHDARTHTTHRHTQTHADADTREHAKAMHTHAPLQTHTPPDVNNRTRVACRCEHQGCEQRFARVAFKEMAAWVHDA
jgi:hypothetical protein